MKFVRFGAPGKEKPGVVAADGTIRDLSGELADVTPDALADETLNRLRQVDLDKLPKAPPNARLGVPLAGISKIIAVGLNYSDHAAEAGMPAPKEPILFAKSITSLSGPNDDVVMPRECTKVDWEVELGVIIGKSARRVSETLALDYVAGFCLANDVSERELQLERGGGQWFAGKSLDTFCPIGPWLVTKDEIPDPHGLDLWLDVNGVRRQNGNTSTMIFKVPFLIHYISRYITLMPGDLILTGTPPGVGMGMKPPMYLAHGDIMELGIGGLGVQRQKVTLMRNT